MKRSDDRKSPDGASRRPHTSYWKKKENLTVTYAGPSDPSPNVCNTTHKVCMPRFSSFCSSLLLTSSPLLSSPSCPLLFFSPLPNSSSSPPLSSAPFSSSASSSVLLILSFPLLSAHLFYSLLFSIPLSSATSSSLLHPFLFSSLYITLLIFLSTLLSPPLSSPMISSILPLRHPLLLSPL